MGWAEPEGPCGDVACDTRLGRPWGGLEGDGAGTERSRAVLTQRARWQGNKSPLGINPPDSPRKRRRSMLRGRLRAITVIISFAIG